ncbi:MAG TPA: heme ABC exporter ATP-binding protein CcmA [Thermoplasmata archaeon]|nr:heme ABC exporter ATP-binding protein CcmA [Thermoplasmata archaeon]
MDAGYLGNPVLRDVSFTIVEPAVYVVLGPNGAGKTTLFRTLAGILRPTQGEVLIGGAPADRQHAHDRLHYLSHMDGMPDGLKVREALEFYARVERAGPADVDRVLDLLEIRELSGQYLGKLSAGQKKRVSIARIFLRERAVYLLDEPTSSLDPKAAREIRSLILQIGKEKVVLYSSHNLFEAREIGQYVIAIKAGRIALFDRIEDLRGAHFVVGVRILPSSKSPEGWTREGDHFRRELSGPEEVPGLIRELETQGVKIREIREMNNPLEDLFT